MTAARKMPFGKYVDMPLPEVPEWYLRWLSEQEWLRDPLRADVLEELRSRDADEDDEDDDRDEDRTDDTGPRHHDDLADDARQWACAIVDAGYRALARRHHPDVGGDTARMQQINAAAEWLRQSTGA